MIEFFGTEVYFTSNQINFKFSSICILLTPDLSVLGNDITSENAEKLQAFRCLINQKPKEKTMKEVVVKTQRNLFYKLNL